MPTKFKHIGLFEGIGGFSLAARWMGWETVAYSEIDRFCISKMQKNFPNARNLGDIKNINAKEYENKIDIITGGFPCQPFSVAGNQNGRNDERYLWGEMLRVIIDVKPTYVVAENVPGLATIEDGLVLRQIRFDLEDAGYKVQVFDIPVAGKNAPHKRNRLWIVAHPRAGMNGYVRESRKQDRHKNLESVLSRAILPTPVAHNAKEMGYPSDLNRNSIGLGSIGILIGEPGPLNPQFVEMMMGYPIGWTE